MGGEGGFYGGGRCGEYQGYNLWSNSSHGVDECSPEYIMSNLGKHFNDNFLIFMKKYPVQIPMTDPNANLADVPGVGVSGTGFSSSNFEMGLSSYDPDTQGYSASGALPDELPLCPRNNDFVWPLQNDTKNIYVSSCVGPRECSGCSPNHKGVDMADANKQRKVIAVDNGVVTFAGGDYGTVVIDHGDGFVTRYLHNSNIKVDYGQEVERGEEIAIIGGRGPNGLNQYPIHLHFEVIKDGMICDPLDPDNTLFEMTIGDRGVKFLCSGNCWYHRHNYGYAGLIELYKEGEGC